MHTSTKFLTIFSAIAMTGLTQAQVTSIRLTDYIKSNGTGNVNPLKNVSVAQLEALRVDNGGVIILGVDVNESSNGTEKASTQAVTLKSVTLTISYSDGSSASYSDGSWLTETQALVAEDPDTARLPRYTLIGETGSSRITANNTIQSVFDSTLKIAVPESLYDPDQGIEATAVDIDIQLLDTNTSLGDPEAFYDFTNGFEDLALLNAEDTAFIDQYGAGQDEAPALIQTNPPVDSDPLDVVTWNYFPSATDYYLVGYEDLYPAKGDYDFNDLTVAYQVRYGLNADNQVVSIRGTAYLLTRGAGYNHDWHLRIELPAGTNASLSCDTFITEYNFGPCDPTAITANSGTADIVVFRQTADIFPAPAGETFTNTPLGQAFTVGPKSDFRLDLNAPVSPSAIAPAPFDPYLQVLNTGETVQLLQVNPAFKDSNGFPFGMLLPMDWRPPNEFYSISDIYPQFDSFVASEGGAALDWPQTFLSGFVVPVPALNIWAW